MEELLHMPLCHTLWTNQMGYIEVKAQLPGIYGNINRPCPRAMPSDSGQFTAINPRQLGFNYYIITYNNFIIMVSGEYSGTPLKWTPLEPKILSYREVSLAQGLGPSYNCGKFMIKQDY